MVLHGGARASSRARPSPGQASEGCFRDPEWPGPWPAEPFGVIEPFLGEPFHIVDTARMPVNVPDRERGPTREYMVRFDEPQLDADGDGPYVSGSVWEKYLVPLDGPLTKESRGNRRIRQRHEEALRRVIASPEDGQVIGRPMADRRFASRPDQPEDDS